MRKTIFATAAVAVFLAGLGSAFAQQKIGVINSQEVLEKSAEGKKVIARIQERDKQYQAEIAKLDEDIRQLSVKLNTQKLTLTEESVASMTAELEKKQTDRKRRAEDAYAGMEDFSKRLFKRLTDEIIPIVSQIGRERNLEVIFDLGKAGVAWVNPAIDVTADVIKKYDASKAGAPGK